MKNGLLARLLVSLSLALILSACHKSGSAANSKAFEAAAPDIKAAWETALAADKTNGYAMAYFTALQLSTSQDLTDPQKQAASSLAVQVYDRMVAGVEKGDEAAKQALQEIRSNSRAMRGSRVPR